MPCSPAKARKLLRDGQAKVALGIPFTIKMLYGCGGITQKVVAGMDTGSKVIGTAVITNNQVVYQAETHLRGENIKKKMEQRKTYRRSRRGRKTRYRKPRFLNRRASTKLDRLAPSVKHKIEAHLREKRFIESILPISKWILETASFDIHKITNPTVSKKHGWTYQKGQQLGFYNAKQYVLARDNYTCQNCKKRKTVLKLHVHHIIFKSNGGTDNPNNLATLCNSCHKKIHNLKEGQAEKASKNLQKKALKPTKHATEISILRSQLTKHFGDFEETFGYITKFNQEALGFSKTHYTDAMIIASQDKIAKTKTDYLVRKLVTKGDYQQTKGVRSEKRIPTGKVFGLRKFDFIKTSKCLGFVKGKRSSGHFAISDIFGKIITNSVNIRKYCKKILARKLILIQNMETPHVQ